MPMEIPENLNYRTFGSPDYHYLCGPGENPLILGAISYRGINGFGKRLYTALYRTMSGELKHDTARSRKSAKKLILENVASPLFA